MNIERERKFLLAQSPQLLKGKLFEGYASQYIESGYFTKDGPAVRVTKRYTGLHGDPGISKVCIKLGSGLERQEFEYTIPNSDAVRLLAASPAYLKKRRFYVGDYEVDQILLNNDFDLWIAEYEEKQSKAMFDYSNVPEWLGREVTDEPGYSMRDLCWQYGQRMPAPPLGVDKERLAELGNTGASFLMTLRENIDSKEDAAVQQLAEKEAAFEAVLNEYGFKTS